VALEEAIEKEVIKEEDFMQERLEQFLGGFGIQFYRLPNTTKDNRIVLDRKGMKIPKSIKSEDGRSIEVAQSRGGDNIFSLSWNTI
jgi:dihydroorotase